MLLKVLLTLCFTLDLTASLQSSLNRLQHSLVSYGNFKEDRCRYLSATVIKHVLAVSITDCVFCCIEEKRCYSVNIGSYPIANKVYLCELLDTDKYRATEKLQANVSFHHFSPWVSQMINFCYNIGFASVST